MAAFEHGIDNTVETVQEMATTAYEPYCPCASRSNNAKPCCGTITSIRPSLNATLSGGASCPAILSFAICAGVGHLGRPIAS